MGLRKKIQTGRWKKDTQSVLMFYSSRNSGKDEQEKKPEDTTDVGVKGCITLKQNSHTECYSVPGAGYILVANPCEHVKETTGSKKCRERPTHLRVAGVSVAKEALVVRWNCVRRYVERLV